MNLTPSEQRAFEKARTQVRALRYQLRTSALAELFRSSDRYRDREPKLAVKLEKK